MESFTWRDEIFAHIARDIDRFGLSIMYIGGGGCAAPGCDGDHPSDLADLGLPPYGYTVGLPFRFDHPELVLVGLDPRSTSQILNGIGDAIAKGARLEPGDLFEVAGTPMKVGRCAVARVRDGLIAVSMDYHYAIEHPSLPNPLQIMWPDASGRFPGEAAYDQRTRRAQPLLARAATRDRPRSRR